MVEVVMMATRHSAAVKKGNNQLAKLGINHCCDWTCVNVLVMAIQAKRKKKIKKPPPRRPPQLGQKQEPKK